MRWGSSVSHNLKDNGLTNLVILLYGISKLWAEDASSLSVDTSSGKVKVKRNNDTICMHKQSKSAAIETEEISTTMTTVTSSIVTQVHDC